MRSLSSRILAVVWSGILALAISLLAGGLWAGLLTTNLASSPTIPWAVIVMALLLWLMWQYLGGRWWPLKTSAARRHYLRAKPLSNHVFVWALVAGLLSIVALTGLWIVLFQLVKVPGNALPDYSRYPLLTVALVLGMASLVASLAEEAGFRGYFQGILEREVGGAAAIVIAAVVIAPGHGLTQGFGWPTLLFYFCVDVMFGLTARLTDSILPGVVIHVIGLLTFFTLVWPYDVTRRLIGDGGVGEWFWIHTGQAIIFTALAIFAFRHLAKVAKRQSPA